MAADAAALAGAAMVAHAAEAVVANAAAIAITDAADAALAKARAAGAGALTTGGPQRTDGSAGSGPPGRLTSDLNLARPEPPNDLTHAHMGI